MTWLHKPLRTWLFASFIPVQSEGANSVHLVGPLLTNYFQEAFWRNVLLVCTVRRRSIDGGARGQWAQRLCLNKNVLIHSIWLGCSGGACIPIRAYGAFITNSVPIPGFLESSTGRVTPHFLGYFAHVKLLKVGAIIKAEFHVAFFTIDWVAIKRKFGELWAFLDAGDII